MAHEVNLLEKRLLHIERNSGNTWIVGNIALAPREEIYDSIVKFLNNYITADDVKLSLISTRHGGKLRNG